MSYFYDQGETLTALTPRFARAPVSGLVENFRKSFEANQKADRFISETANKADAYEPIIEALNEGRSRPERFFNPWRQSASTDFARRSRAWRNPDQAEAEIWDTIAAARQKDPGAFPALPQSRDDMNRRIKESVQQADAAASEALERADGWGAIGAFGGRMSSAVTDPPVFLTMFTGAGAATGIGRTALIEGLIGMGTEAAIQPQVQSYRGESGLESGFDEGLKNVLIGGAGGAIFGGGLKALAKGVSKVRDFSGRKTEELLEEYRKSVPDPDPEQRARMGLAQAEADFQRDNVFGDTPQNRVEHGQRLAGATAAADEGDFSAIPDRVAEPPPGAKVTAPENPDRAPIMFDPDELEVDARLFQFKEGGDAEGVTERLRGVREWDPLSAGSIVVYEFADGRRFIADGHQRLGLARRLKEGGDQEIRLYGYLIREADGARPDDARVAAALKNIREGTGTAVDAAKILRSRQVAPDSLPPNSALVRNGRHLAELKDEPFGMVINGVVPENYGAAVGRFAGDQDEAVQSAIMRAMRDAEPENQAQAESVVRQALAAGIVRTSQGTLFGEEELAQSLLKERAKVMDLATRRLRKDRSVFETLARERSRIEEEGNKVNADKSRRRADLDAQTIQIIQSQAERKGPLSDALRGAAERAATEGSYSGAVDDFITAVRDAAERGDLDGSGIGGRGIDGAPDSRPASNDNAGQTDQGEFAVPGGDGQRAQADFLETEAWRQFRSVGAAVTPVIEKVRHLVAVAFDPAEAASRHGRKERFEILGSISDENAIQINEVLRSRGVDINATGGRFVLREDEVRHIMKQHGDEVAETGRGQIPIKAEDFELLPEILSRPDNIVNPSRSGAAGRQQRNDVVQFERRIDADHVVVVAVSLGQRKGRPRRLSVLSYWKRPVRDGEAGPPGAVLPPRGDRQQNVRNDRGATNLDDNIAVSGESFNGDAEVPVGRINDGDDVVADVRGLRDILDEAEADRDFEAQLDICQKPEGGK